MPKKNQSVVEEIGLREYLGQAELGIGKVNEQTSPDEAAKLMIREGERLDKFVFSVISAAENVVQTGLIPSLVTAASYMLPPLPRPFIKLRPNDKYYYRFASKEMILSSSFRADWVVPKYDHSAGIEFEFCFVSSNQHFPESFDMDFNINYPETMKAFKWLFTQWRRPMCQMLRGAEELKLWGNGSPLDSIYGVRTKNPEALLETHFANQKKPEDNMVSMRCSFRTDNEDQSVILTAVVFLSLFDSIYKLTTNRANPNCLLRNYETIMPHLPKAPFRISSIYPLEKENNL